MWPFKRNFLKLSATARGIDAMICKSMRQNYDEWKEETGYEGNRYDKITRGAIEVRIYHDFNYQQEEPLARVYVHQPHGITRISDKVYRLRNAVKVAAKEREEADRLRKQYNAIQQELM